MNLYMVSRSGWGIDYVLVEASSEEEAVKASGLASSPLYPPEVERIDLQGRPARAQ
jgi:hypothetical protein